MKPFDSQKEAKTLPGFKKKCEWQNDQKRQKVI